MIGVFANVLYRSVVTHYREKNHGVPVIYHGNHRNLYPSSFCQLIHSFAVPWENFIAVTTTAAEGSFVTSSFAASMLSTAIGYIHA